MAWMQLVLAEISEMIWVMVLESTQGFTKWVPSIIVCIFAILSYQFLSMAVRSFPIGTGYAVWTGIATVDIVVVAIAFREEPTDTFQLICIGLILLGGDGLAVDDSSVVGVRSALKGNRPEP